ncbi:AAA family ATPase [Wohlfahrtiimonas chitiniclastica]|nr:AAA family ATPase [Wohlfahrtiimonas chitiniclastica]
MQLMEIIHKLDIFLDIYKNNEVLHASNIEAITKLKEYLKEFEYDIQSDTYRSNSPYQEAIKNIKKSLIDELKKYSFEDNFAVSVNGYKSVDLNLIDTSWPDIKQINEDFKRIQLLKVVKDIEYSIVLLGANGSGKSSFANFLKGTAISNVCVLPAQKILQIYMNGSYDYRANVEKVRMQQGESFAKGNRDLYYTGSDFTHLITALSGNELQLIVDEREQRITEEEYAKSSHFLKLTKIFYQLIPNIKLRIDSHSRLFIPSKYGSDYAFEQLSDGEKALLYYIGNILLANQKSFIIIDEPETYINPSIYKKLWDILIKERSDCQFIFITHSMDFIASRKPEQTKFFWMKKFIYPESWDIEALPIVDHLPKSLIAELAASKKNIIFCEGELSSLDYRVYSMVILP